MSKWHVTLDIYQQAMLCDEEGMIAKGRGMEAVFNKIADRHNAEQLSQDTAQSVTENAQTRT